MKKETVASILLVCNLSIFARSQTACVLEHCGLQLAECEANRVCRTWSNCCRNCNIKDTDCQIRCGDLYKPTNESSEKIVSFSECTISEHHCIPQTTKKCYKPREDSLVKNFSLSDMVGKWYITRGLNKLFDCFDCQVHTFRYNPKTSQVKPLVGDLKYNVKVDLNCSANCTYLPRQVFQNFSQDKQIPGHLMNHNNSLAEMHYNDDWYILYASSSAVLVYYCGCNDASCGYSGAVLYSRQPSLPPEDESFIRDSIRKSNIPQFTFDDMCIPANTFC